jgi:hypothetical protein
MAEPKELAFEDLDVLISKPGQPAVSIHTSPRPLPVSGGDHVGILVRLTRPAYLYVVWINSRGEAQPLYPWARFDWTARRVEEKTLNVSLPALEGDGRRRAWPIDTPAGIETLVVLAGDSRLSGDAAQEFRGSWSGFPTKKELPDRNQAFSITPTPSGRLGLKGGIKLGDPVPIDDPIHEIETLLRERFTPRFPLIRAVSFANVGDGPAAVRVAVNCENATLPAPGKEIGVSTENSSEQPVEKQGDLPRLLVKLGAAANDAISDLRHYVSICVGYGQGAKSVREIARVLEDARAPNEACRTTLLEAGKAVERLFCRYFAKEVTLFEKAGEGRSWIGLSEHGREAFKLTEEFLHWLEQRSAGESN